MRCGDARPDLSALLDDELAPERADAVREHVASCAPCTRYERDIHTLRTRLRIAPVEHVVDIEPLVRVRLDERAPERRPRTVSLLSIAAAFVAAFVAGATFVQITGNPEPVGARDLSDAVLVAQASIESLEADVTVVERGFHPDVPERTFVGTIAYRAPESLALELRDTTAYPSDEWVRDDVTLVVDGDRSWERAVVRCPREALPGCTPRAPRTRALVGRDPFSDTGPAPLDLVVPVGSFGRSGAVEDLGQDRIDGRSVVGVRVTAAQVEPLLGGLRSRGNAREIHPTDVVDLWLDNEVLVPVALDVRAAPTTERSEWAARRGYDDADGVIVGVRWTNIRVDAAVTGDAFANIPTDAITRDAGFATTPVTLAAPTWLPPGMEPARAGVVRGEGGPEVELRAWSDGRAWVKVAATTQWPGGRLFGDLGPVVREIAVGAGVGYLDERGERVAVHGSDGDVVVTGSIATDDLVRVAASLAVGGVPVPLDWYEAATVSLDDVQGGALLVATDSGEPAVRRTGDTVTLAYAGPGARGFLVVEAPGAQLGPPFDPDARSIDVRDTTGRWSPRLGTLEWVEDSRADAAEPRTAQRGSHERVVVSITSRTLGLGELVALAETMTGARP
ncbi:MAG: zf-HC2 domain-containing protein [Actinomycetota bacterium]|nr:zf-HC2 domain-containing protein [Actinomycetota bacterium]